MRRYRKGITPFRSARQRPCAQGGTFFFSSRRRHTRSTRDWSSDVCSSDLSAFSAGSLLVSGASVSLFGSGTVLHLNFDVKAGSLSWSNSATLDKLTLEGGSFGGSGTLTVITFDWNGAQLSGGWSTLRSSGGTIQTAAEKQLQAPYTWNNTGS